jgi:hypothetical protein
VRDVELREEIPVARLRRGRDVEPPFQDLHTSVPSTPKLTRTAHTLRADAAASTARSPWQGESWHGRCAVPRAVGAGPHALLARAQATPQLAACLRARRFGCPTFWARAPRARAPRAQTPSAHPSGTRPHHRPVGPAPPRCTWPCTQLHCRHPALFVVLDQK